jgi:HEAT repeat protein
MGRGRVRALLERIDSLYADTLKGGYDDDLPWKAIGALHRNGSHAVFVRAVAWCTSPHPIKRARAADILAQLLRAGQSRRNLTSRPEWMFRAESYDLITRMLEKENDTYALGSEITALGHLDNAAAIPLVAKFAKHTDENVRFAVAYALGSHSCHDDPRSVDVLRELMEDTDQDVRDWAIFGLGVQGNADSEEIRAAFLRHLDDPFLDARIEAAAALGKRHDARLAEPLIRMLKKHRALRGLVEAARNLLELSEDPPDWFETEYITALENRFTKTQ